MVEQAVSQWLHLLMKIDNTEQNGAFLKDQFIKRKTKNTQLLKYSLLHWGTEFLSR